MTLLDRLTSPTQTGDLRQDDPFTYAEIKRITDIPIQHPLDPVELEEFNRNHIQATYYDQGFRLLPAQANGLYAYQMFGTLFGRVLVGDGKTLTSLMIANHAYKKGRNRIMLCVPPNVLGQLVETDIPWARSRVDLNLPIHILGGKGIEARRSLSASGRKGLYIMPYSLLRTEDTHENLTAIKPELIILDEAHNLSGRSSAQTRRMMSFIEKNLPELIVLSGTITRKSVKDYHHLLKNSLRTKCPLPIADRMVDDWAALIDAEASKDQEGAPTQANPREMAPLVKWAGDNFPNNIGDFSNDVYGFRRAYDVRLTTTPGVVSSDGSGIGTSLVMHNDPVPEYEKCEGWPKLKQLMDDVTDKWLTPNGDEISHAMLTWKWLNELCGAGFYNELIWPTPEKFSERKKISVAEATDIVERAKIHHAAGQAYEHELRAWLDSHSRPSMDTPFLVGLEMARNGSKNTGEGLYSTWRDWKDLDFDGRPDRDSHARRICPFKINHAVKWAKQLGGKGAIVWIYHQEAGNWLYESLIEEGLPAVHCPAGDRFNHVILDPANTNKIMVASIKAHGQGKNLQHFSEQYFLQWPRDSVTAEQALGRTHRTGQKADELVVWTNQTLIFDQMNFAACLNDALYTHQTGGGRQKLIYASYDPLPKIFPPAVLVEKGLEARRLDRRQEELMREKFGEYSK